MRGLRGFALIAVLAACGANPPAANPPPSNPLASNPPAAAAHAEGHSAARRRNVPPPMDSVDYAVYSAVLRSYLAEEDSAFVLMDSTLALGMDIIAESYLVDAFRKSAPYAAHLFGRLFFYSEQRYPLQPAFSLEGKVRLMPDAEFRGLFGVGPGEAWEDHEVDGWAALRARYPGASGRYELSRVAFDLDRSIALVFFRMRCGTVCERASYVVLRRSGDTWKVETADVAFRQGDDHTYDAHAGPDTVYADIPQGPPPPTPRP